MSYQAFGIYFPTRKICWAGRLSALASPRAGRNAYNDVAEAFLPNGSSRIWFEVDDRWWIVRLIRLAESTELKNDFQTMVESFGLASYSSLPTPTIVTYLAGEEALNDVGCSPTRRIPENLALDLQAQVEKLLPQRRSGTLRSPRRSVRNLSLLCKRPGSRDTRRSTEADYFSSRGIIPKLHEVEAMLRTTSFAALNSHCWMYIGIASGRKYRFNARMIKCSDYRTTPSRGHDLSSAGTEQNDQTVPRCTEITCFGRNGHNVTVDAG